ncbi:MAG: 2-phosphosulfolactate phosphatase [Gemmatimonadales bacterium]|nr:MAG: 2-phosphosulfolactate phosphatase [Gemmatimonadales bacterium]
MKVEVYFSATEAEGRDYQGRTAVVIDVIRATTVMVQALASGARAIYPTHSSEEAIRLANSLGREDTLLCGERKGLKVEGFDLGNSPREFTPKAVEGRRLVMTTTNGTRAFLAAQGAERVLAGSLLNLSATTREALKADALTLICAGKEGAFSLDDALCAGLILQAMGSGVHGEAPELELNDQARASLAFADAFPGDAPFLRRTAAGAALIGIGLDEDLQVCADRDRYSLIPEMHDRMIRTAKETS